MVCFYDIHTCSYGDKRFFFLPDDPEQNGKKRITSLWQQSSKIFDEVINKGCYLIIVTTAYEIEQLPEEILEIVMRKRSQCTVKLEAPTAMMVQESIPRIVNIFKRNKIRKLRRRSLERNARKIETLAVKEADVR